MCPQQHLAPTSRGGWAPLLCPQAFQKVLRSKRPVYEATLRSGRALREGARLPEDLQPLEELLGELKERWDALCGRAAERWDTMGMGMMGWDRMGYDGVMGRSRMGLAMQVPGGGHSIVPPSWASHSLPREPQPCRTPCPSPMEPQPLQAQPGSISSPSAYGHAAGTPVGQLFAAPWGIGWPCHSPPRPWALPGPSITHTVPRRQHKLEENLLFSGKFTDALQALMDWLYRAEPQLSEDVPVGGDRDLVSDLMDKHKVGVTCPAGRSLPCITPGEEQDHPPPAPTCSHLCCRSSRRSWASGRAASRC